MISVISFNALGEHAGCVSARCETATLKSEHSRKNVNSFIASLSHFVFIWSKLARSLCDINASCHNQCVFREGTFLIAGGGWAGVFFIFFVKNFVALPSPSLVNTWSCPIPILQLHMHQFTTIGNSTTLP